LWLTRWLDIFYESNELEEYASYCNSGLKKAKPANRFLIMQALSESKKLSWRSRDQLVRETAEELSVLIPEIEEWAKSHSKKRSKAITDLDKEIEIEITNKQYENALKKLTKFKDIDEAKSYFGIGLVYDLKNDFSKAEQYYLMAVEKGNEQAMLNLGFFYMDAEKDYDKAEKYYLMAVEKENEQAMFNLGVLYKNVKKDYDKAEKYYLMAVEKGNEQAMFNLGFLYQDVEKDYDKAEQYYLMAVEKGDDMAMVSLGVLYNYIKKDYDKAEKYFLMAVKKGDDVAMVSLGLLYDDIKKDYSKAEKYYLMAVGKGNDMAKNNLAFLFYEKNDIDKKLTALSITEDLDKSDPIFFATRVQLLLWNEKIKEASNVLNEFIKKYLQVAEAFQSISDALISFLVFKQKQFLYQLFTTKEYESLTDKFKPVYFALLHEMKTELPDEYLKMTEEISEPVNDLLKLVKEERKRLGIE
ncbi:MAG: sel1 repeat family protein, partial [Bacteroidota bacterium]|nr:sel1 repeat family protein [Bacteroidota bacterium]